MFLCLCVFPFSVGRCVSLDCEMVGTGPAGDFSMLARCSIVNHHGNVLYDSYVAPMDKITDYRTKFSGITAQHLRGGMYMYMYMHIQDSPHTGREWSAPTTTQHFLPPLRLVLPSLTGAEMLCLMQFDSTIAKV